MGDINMANRQCCDLDIRDYATKKPFLDANFCNTTTMGFTSDPTYAMKKGGKCIKFDNPMDGTISMTFQVHPFKVYAMLSDGEIETSAVIATKEVLTGANDGTLTLTSTPITGSVFVYAVGEYGNANIAGTVADKVFTPTDAGDIVENTKYEVAYLEEKSTGVKKVSFNDKKIPKYYYIQMSTLDKDEAGNLVPMRITAYKASPQRSLDLSFSSDGEAAEYTITFDALKDENENVLDMIEITE